MKEENGKIERHPSYCLARMHRIQGGNSNFYGSVIRPNHYIQLEIIPSYKRVNEFGDENFNEEHGQPAIISVRMTHHQFAELITTMNTGNGTPVTLTRDHGKRVDDCPVQTNPLTNVIETSVENMDSNIKEMEKYIDEIRDITSTGKVSAKSQKRLETLFSIIKGRVEENAQFYKKQIQEVGVEVVTNVKTEVDALITSKVIQLGLDELAKFKMVEHDSN